MKQLRCADCDSKIESSDPRCEDEALCESCTDELIEEEKASMGKAEQYAAEVVKTLCGPDGGRVNCFDNAELEKLLSLARQEEREKTLHEVLAVAPKPMDPKTGPYNPEWIDGCNVAIHVYKDIIRALLEEPKP